MLPYSGAISYLACKYHDMLRKSMMLLALLAFACITVQAQDDMNKTLRHVVLFKFKDASSAEDVKKVEEAFKDLPSKISEIKAFEWGTNNSPEGLNQGLTHCFLLTFESEADRDAYLIHPDHQEFGKLVGQHLDKVTVVDYWSM